MIPNNTKWNWICDKQIPSDPNIGVKLICDLLEQLQQCGWSEKDIFAIHMSFEEALMNAIKHGNCRDLDKLVEVALRTSHKQIYIKITDEGRGFDPDSLPDPTQDEYIERPCGRGVMLMRCYMDVVIFNDAGNSVEMFKKRTHP